MATLFPAWRILIGPLPFPALVFCHYSVRASIVSYVSLATASGLVQLGLMLSFQRVVAVREGRVMVGVAAGCVVSTAAHLLLEAAARNHLELQHVSRDSVNIWLSQGEVNPFLINQGGTGLLYLPHVFLLLLIKITILVMKLQKSSPQQANRIMSLYQLTRIESWYEL